MQELKDGENGARGKKRGKVKGKRGNCLGAVPGEAAVNVDGEGDGEVEGGDAEAGRESLEGQVAHSPHVRLRFLPHLPLVLPAALPPVSDAAMLRRASLGPLFLASGPDLARIEPVQ